MRYQPERASSWRCDVCSGYMDLPAPHTKNTGNGTCRGCADMLAAREAESAATPQHEKESTDA